MWQDSYFDQALKASSYITTAPKSVLNTRFPCGNKQGRSQRSQHIPEDHQPPVCGPDLWHRMHHPTSTAIYTSSSASTGSKQHYVKTSGHPCIFLFRKRAGKAPYLP